MDDPRAAVAHSVTLLTASGARTEVRAERRRGRRLGPLGGREKVVAVGRVWRLGALLLDADGRLYRTGTVIQAQALRFDNHQSERAVERRALRESILRGGIDAGETVNIDVVEVDPAEVATVSWNGSGDPATLVPLAGYLRERAELLANPPAGS